jgi:glycerophosphodiester phosphodiesterase family protein
MEKIILITLVAVCMNMSSFAVKTVGHRGSLYGVENTETAFINGVNNGYDGLECDIRTTKDGKFVICHDEDLKRFGHDSIIIAENDEAFLLSLPLKQKRSDGNLYEGYLCSLGRFLDICKLNGVFPVIEIKWSRNIYSDNKNPDRYCYDGIPELLELIDSKGLSDKVVILTSMKGVLDKIRAIDSNIGLQLLSWQNWEQHVDWCKDRNIDIDICKEMKTDNMVKTFHDIGLKVNVWTVDNDSEYDMYRDLGVDMITTNFIKPRK